MDQYFLPSILPVSQLHTKKHNYIYIIKDKCLPNLLFITKFYLFIYLKYFKCISNNFKIMSNRLHFIQLSISFEHKVSTLLIVHKKFQPQARKERIKVSNSIILYSFTNTAITSYICLVRQTSLTKNHISIEEFYQKYMEQFNYDCINQNLHQFQATT